MANILWIIALAVWIWIGVVIITDARKDDKKIKLIEKMHAITVREWENDGPPVVEGRGITIALAPQAAVVTPVTLRSLFDAIREVETGGCPDPANALGDGGRSLGPYQIGRAYWQDSRVPGEYNQVRDQQYAERVMVGYWMRWCPDAMVSCDAQTLARVHNGGPRGGRKPATRNYWRLVSDQLIRQSKPLNAAEAAR